MPATINIQSNEKREAKRIHIIRAASALMNERGATSINLNSVAKIVGLSRNALYYYFNDRFDLIYACYLLAGEATKADLEAALSEGSSSVSKLQRYIEITLRGPNAERAVLSDVELLPLSQKTHIFQLNQSNQATLETLVQEGISRQEIRPVNPAIAAQVLQGMLSWAQLWYRWVDISENDLTNRYATAASAIIDSFLYGMSSDHNIEFTYPLRIHSLMDREVDAFDPKSVNNERLFQLIGTASLLFNRRGVDATSLDDIAAYLGTTKGAVYHYFKNKPSLVKACFLQAFDIYEKILVTSENSDLSNLNKMLTVVHLNCQAQTSKAPPLTLQGGVSKFSAHYGNRSKSIARKSYKMHSAAIKEGQHRLTHKASIDLSPGVFYWIPSWFHSQSDVNEIELADEVCKIMLKGIAY